MAAAVTVPAVIDSIRNDPSNDDYHFFRGGDLDQYDKDILQRYKRFNSPDGNSITDEDSPETYPTQQTTIPTTEDINLDQNLAEGESYFHYKIPLRPQDMVVGQGFITDRIMAEASTPSAVKANPAHRMTHNTTAISAASTPPMMSTSAKMGSVTSVSKTT